MESAHSIRFLYRHFLSGITEKSLNAFYYACTHAKVDYSRFMNVSGHGPEAGSGTPEVTAGFSLH